MNSDPGYGHAFARWRQAAPDWNAYTRHSFVEGGQGRIADTQS